MEREPVVVYVRRGCGYCVRALALFSELGIEPAVVDATGRPELRAWLAEVSGQRTVPQIFLYGRAIGGYSELRLLEMEGALDELPEGDDLERRSTALG